VPEAVIVDAVRTPIGKRRGSLADVHPVDLSASVLTALVQRTGVDPELVDDVLWGCVNQVGDQAAQIGRYAVLAAGWPETVPGVTINRACGSSQSSFDFAAGMVLAGQYDLVVAGGVESMTRVPLGSGRDIGSQYGPLVRERYQADLTSGEFPGGDFNQGIGAERIARRWGFSRRTLDEYAARSHELAAAATDRGDFAEQLAPVPCAPGLVADEGLRRGTTADTLAKLKPSFRADGVIHAGNASQISDGAAAVVVTSAAKAEQLGLSPLAELVSFGMVAGPDPSLLTQPSRAINRALDRADMKVSDLDLFELNEAFAAVGLASMRDLGITDDVVNVNGGAIALGHPIGMSGTRVVLTLVNELRRRGGGLGAAALCGGGGQGEAAIVRAL
jgi:acetyl-CoA acyltransferase